MWLQDVSCDAFNFWCHQCGQAVSRSYLSGTRPTLTTTVDHHCNALLVPNLFASFVSVGASFWPFSH